MKVPSIGIEINLSMIVSGSSLLESWKKAAILSLRESIRELILKDEGDASKGNLASANKRIVTSIQAIVLL